jgi:hypothetical protein
MLGFNSERVKVWESTEFTLSWFYLLLLMWF